MKPSEADDVEPATATIVLGMLEELDRLSEELRSLQAEVAGVLEALWPQLVRLAGPGCGGPR